MITAGVFRTFFHRYAGISLRVIPFGAIGAMEAAKSLIANAQSYAGALIAVAVTAAIVARGSAGQFARLVAVVVLVAVGALLTLRSLVAGVTGAHRDSATVKAISVAAARKRIALDVRFAIIPQGMVAVYTVLAFVTGIAEIAYAYRSAAPVAAGSVPMAIENGIGAFGNAHAITIVVLAKIAAF